MYRMVLFGDSHLKAVSSAISQGDRQWLATEYVHNGTLLHSFVLELATGETILNPMISRFMLNQGLCDPYSFTPVPFEGDIVFQFGTIMVPRLSRAIDVDVRASGKSVDAAEYRIGSGALKLVGEMLTEKFAAGLRIVKKGWPAARLFVLAGPPPVRDPVRFNSTMHIANAPSPENRLSFYRANVETLLHVVGAAGAHLIEAPRSACDADGFLLPQFEHDGLHANTGYGRHVVAQLAEIQQQRQV